VGGPAAAFTAARASWSPASADGERSVDLIEQLATLRKPIKSASQLVHGDLYGTVLFAGSAAPGITDMAPTGGRRRGRPVWWSSTPCPGVRPTTG
jgi:fructosamine-3-kinase